MLKQSIGVGMLCLAGHAYSANISVTTTEDVVKDDQECSLREAVSYINQDMPKEGYFGCGGEDASPVILLEKQKVYKLNSHLNIQKELTIKTNYDVDFNETPVLGKNNAVLQMQAKDNILRIDDGSQEKLLSVVLYEVSLEGCGQAECAQQGGLIYNNEYLQLSYAGLSGGYAAQGGAIYNVSNSTVENTSDSLVVIQNSLFEKNYAAEGAVLYTQRPAYKILNSVVRHNETTSPASANIYAALLFNSEQLPSSILNVANYIKNSTFLQNKGYLLNLRDGIGLNNLTMIGNAQGVQFVAPQGKAFLANSILIGNPYPITTQQDCKFETGDQSILQNNLVSADCGQGLAEYPNEIWTQTALIAGSTLEGKCSSANLDRQSLVCPFNQSSNDFLGYFKPRLLVTYQQLSDSLIVNKGKQWTGSETALVECESSDQRGQVRDSNNVLCDRGAIELVFPTTISLIGDDINYGEVAKMSVAELLGDGELLPKDQCEALLGTNPTGEAWQDGCLQVIPTTTQPKGRVTIDEEGNIQYTPNGNWHGADIFKIRLVTTTTRFNDSQNPYLEIKVQVTQAPAGQMKSSKVETSGGSAGILSLLGLLGLIGLRRYKK
ncbi:rhombotarget A [Acinetobacter tandoii]|uniref:rhombotarget A n=1 Tax=Acinetobacter tandoii TaxID=202954 RepID=UPI000C20E67B|nr:rhombotarget A [Acinetobacter tandoii]PJG44327.1 rhombotarget A [Acinetobacter tandoii]